MTRQQPTRPQQLDSLRAKIDAVDESIHGLLMQRAGVIDELIRVKGAAETKGAAFRPGREAAMMDVLKGRHSGSIPFSMIAHLWREIISTFTFMQAEYSVHLASVSDDPTGLHDITRYQFGFTVPLTVHENCERAMEAARSAGNGIVVIPADAPQHWWAGLGADAGLLVMARTPHNAVPFQCPDAFCIAPPLSDPAPFDVRLYDAVIADEVTVQSWAPDVLVRQDISQDGRHVALIALREGQKAPPGLLDIRAIGGYFAPSR